MAEPADTRGAQTSATIRKVALRLIARHGFEAMSLRHLATEVGIQAASFYNHFATKQDLLFGLIYDHMMALLADTDRALAAAAADPAARLAAFAAHHVVYHIDKKHDVYIANFELRALTAANHSRIVALRRAYENRLIGVLDEGIELGVFRCADTHVAAYAILAMLTGVCTWYKPGGRLPQHNLVALHVDMALQSLGAASPPADPPSRVRTGHKRSTRAPLRSTQNKSVTAEIHE